MSEVIDEFAWLIKGYIGEWSQLFAQVSLCDATLSLPIVPLEQVSDLFSRDGQVLAVTRLKEGEVVIQCAKAFHLFVNRPIQVSQIDLWYLVLALQLEIVLQSDDVFEKLSKFETCGLIQAQVWLEGVADVTFTHASIHV